VKVDHQNGASSESLYDGAGMRRVRIERSADGTVHETRFIDPSAEVQDGKLVRWIVHGGQRLARLADGNGVPEPSKGGGCAAAPTSTTSSGVALFVAMLGLGAVVVSRKRRLAVAVVALAAVCVSLLGCSGGGSHENVQQILDGSIQTLTDADELLFTDALGSLTEITSGTGATGKGSFATYPYGVTRYDSASETNKYSGAPRDMQVGVDLMGARAYVAELGVWISTDPLRLSEPERGLRAGFAQDHAYAYARLAPTNAIDGSGGDPTTAQRWLSGASTVLSTTHAVVDFVASPITGGTKDVAEAMVNGGIAVARGHGADYAKQFVINGNIPGEIASHTMPSLMPQTKDGEQARIDKRGVSLQIVGAFLPPAKGGAAVKELPSAAKTVAEGVEHCVGGACCFAAGTQVLTEAGERPIETIEIGDRVLSRDADTGEIAMHEVVWLKPPADSPIVAVTVRNDKGDAETLRTTTEHVFWAEKRGWLRVADLQPGDQLVSAAGGRFIVTALQQSANVERVYNFEVEGTHTYFVGSAHVLVHNSCADRIAKTGTRFMRGPFATGAYDELSKSVAELNKVVPRWAQVDAHHAGQKAAMKAVAAGYDEAKGAAIIVPKLGHTYTKEGVGVLSRSTKGLTTAAEVV
jgi:RHS repeat-associated protein/MYXO-CTERM domain-containing protein